MNNLDKEFSFLDVADRIIIKRLIEKLSNEFPSWYCRGYSLNEIKNIIKK